MPEEDIQHVNFVGGNKWGEEAGEGGLTLILSVGEGGVEINFCLVRGGGCDLIFSRILSISQPPSRYYCKVPKYEFMK